MRRASGSQSRLVVRPVRTPDRTRETKWIRDNRSAYADQWVAVESDRLIAAGMDARTVLAAAKVEGIESPFVVHIPPEDSLPFVPGW